MKPVSEFVGTIAPAREKPLPMTAVILAPRWRLGFRGAAKRSVADCSRALRPHVRRLIVAGQGARVLEGFPVLCRQSLRPILSALLHVRTASLADLLRRPCARLVTLD